MKRYCNVEPILHLLSDKDLLESVNVGAVLQALQHGLYNGEVAPVVHAHWTYEIDDLFPADSMMICSNCGEYERLGANDNYCGNCGAKMDEKEGNL